MEWEYQGEFLKQFNTWERNMATQMFCRAYRGLPSVYVTAPKADKTPAENLTQMLERLDVEITERSAQDWITVELRSLLAKLTIQLQDEELKNFARFIAAREKRPQVEKDLAREDSKKIYVQKALSKKPASIKQIEYLKKLGYTGPVNSMAEASVLIEKFKG